MNPEMYQELVRQINSLQKQVDGLVKPEVGRWLDWTPTITQGVAVTFNTTYARYIVSNNIAVVQAHLVATSNGTVGQPIVIGGQPTIMQPSNVGTLDAIGSGVIIDQTVGWYTATVVSNTATDWRFLRGDVIVQYIGANPNFGLASGDLITFDTVYEI